MKVEREGARPVAQRRGSPDKGFTEALRRMQRGPPPEARAGTRPAPPRPPQPRQPLPVPLRAVAPAVLVSPAVSSRTPRGPEQLREVRRGHDAEAARLGEVRLEAGQHHLARTDERTRELLRQTLEGEPLVPAGRRAPLAPPPPGEESPGRELPPPPLTGSADRGATNAGLPREGARAAASEALVALVAHIEVLVRSQRPALALTLGGGLAERVELERTGPGEVAVTLVGCRSKVGRAALEGLREAMQARGLKLRRLVLSGGDEALPVE